MLSHGGTGIRVYLQLVMLCACVLCLLIQLVNGGNIAFGKSTSQNRTKDSRESKYAVDGNKTQTTNYSHADYPGNTGVAFWEVDLGQEYQISKIEIWFGTPVGTDPSQTLARRRGYSLRLSNSTSSDQSGQLCYQHNSINDEDHVVFTNCSYWAKYVRLYSVRPIESWSYDKLSLWPNLQITEVEVEGCTEHCKDPKDETQGCKLGWYSDSCYLPCSTNCTACNKTTGACLACDSGYHGDNCTLPCSTHCTDAGCDKTTGMCLSCDSGYHGDNCTLPCSTYCTDAGCNKKTGTCSACDSGYHGDNCTLPCSTHCTDADCDKKTGTCSACDSGYHGDNCTLPCSTHCTNAVCDKKTGMCSACDSGYHGDNCILPCPTNCTDAGCDKKTGTCSACDSGYHGDNCTLPCSTHCTDADCDKKTGMCSVCDSGYHGDNCTLPCPTHCTDVGCVKTTGMCFACNSGYHDIQCNLNCSQHCSGGTCHINGSCQTGCEDGYYGDTCTARCNKQCLDPGCERWGGTCGNCTDGYHGDRCQTPCNQKCKSGDNGVACEKGTGKCSDGCKVRYYGDTCESSCPKGCKRCENILDCKVCDDDTVWGDICDKSCPNTCKESKCAKNDSKCQNCVSGYHGDSCRERCSSNCADGSCHRNATCDIACEDNFYGLTCSERCDTRITNCVTCSRDGSTCSLCKASKFDFMCKSDCPVNCEQCTDINTCLKCKRGYIGDTCQTLCYVGCLDCDSQRCLICEGNKFGDNCEYNCTENCASCNATGPGTTASVCSRCETGYFLRGDRCTRCSRNCVECSTFSTCTLCKNGYYGSACNNDCPTNCVTCQSRDNCISCKTGWEGQKCHCSPNCTNTGDDWCGTDGNCTKGCISGMYGQKCSRSCPDQHCKICYQNSGVCETCTPGLWIGTVNGLPGCNRGCGHCTTQGDGQPVCDSTTGHCTPCQTGWYWDSCMRECSSHCMPALGKPVACVQDNGYCPACEDGFHGPACDKTCSKHCLDNQGQRICTQTDGTCLFCTEGFYGPSCNKACSQSCKSGCDKSSGECVQCVPGYHGLKCEENCSSSCGLSEGSGLVICNQSNGECLTCHDGQYGGYCNYNCSDRCLTMGPMPGPCDKANGKCVDCRDGLYGQDCELNCSNNCLPKSGEMTPGRCDRFLGRCTDGCSAGWYNDTCNTNCNENCIENRCNQNGGECTDGCTGYFTGVFCIQAAKQVVKPAGMNTALIAIVICALIVFSVILIGGVIWYRRRKQNEHGGQGNVPLRNLRNGVESRQSASYVNINGKNSANKLPLPERQRIPGDDDLADEDNELAPLMAGQGMTASDYYNLSTQVPVDGFVAYVQGRRDESKDWYKEDFQKLPKGLLKSCSVAFAPANKGKCRYKNLYPYDHTRVILQKEGADNSSDFINASYVSGYKKPEAFIAAQGPTDVNLNDFWRMIYQKDCGKIVMLTNLFEELKMKCVMYWPELDSSETYGNIDVTFTHEDVFPDYIVRHLTAKMKGTSVEKSILQFHFTAWPDRGVPDNPGCILHFKDKVMEPAKVPDGPILVHCSAGIGRTGTFIVVDYLIAQARAESHIDVFRCVTDMRYQRTNFVQTDIQYEFIHNALVEAMSTKDLEISAQDFCRVYWEELQVMDEDTGRTKLHEQFETLVKLSPQPDEDSYTAGSDPENLLKNRFQDIIPVNSFRAYLSTPVHGRNEYINAVFLSSYTDKYAYILTQMPLVDTIVDFWRLVYDQRCTTIVMMNDVQNIYDNTVGEYWPSEDTTYGPFSVELISCENNDFYSTMTMKLTYTTSTKKDTMTVKQLRFEDWGESEDQLPYNSESLVKFISVVSQERQQNKQAPAIIHCMNGLDRSGLFCVLASVLEEIQMANKVNIVHTILQLRSRRPQLIHSFEQFDYCHKAIAGYLDSSQIYSNFL